MSNPVSENPTVVPIDHVEKLNQSKKGTLQPSQAVPATILGSDPT